MRRIGQLLGLLVVGAALWLTPGVARAAAPVDDLRDAGALVAQALKSAQAGDLAAAASSYKAFENRWFDIEDGVREVSRESYRAIEGQMSQVNIALAATPPSKDAVTRALAALAAENDAFIAGKAPVGGAAAPATAGTQPSSISALLEILAATKTAVQAGDWTTATARWDVFGAMWIDVEGQVKTRSAGDYRAIEDDTARVSTALNAKSASATTLLDGMNARLTPYISATTYGPFDATIIIFREGMEAMLVVVALLAFLKRSGNEDKGRFIWGGAAVGLVGSIALGIAINAILGKAFTGENREFMEGATGLVAAAMLLYVSYWLHSKSSLGAWQHYINDRTTQALATGSLYGLAMLSFLAVFREGGETVLFFLGMAGNITAQDLMIGLGVGAVILAVIGVLLTVVGMRIPIRPFFQVASVLTFYLCFKFLGTGIHAMQVADLLPARTAEVLPANDILGLYPTWETTLVQLALVALALGIWGRGLLADRTVRAHARPEGDAAV